MSFQSILTKYIPPTNTRGARIKAVQSGWNDKRQCASITIPYPHELNTDQAHALAARMLAEKLDWPGQWAPASLGAFSDFAYCFCRVDSKDFFTVEKKERAAQ